LVKALARERLLRFIQRLSTNSTAAVVTYTVLASDGAATVSYKRRGARQAFATARVLRARGATELVVTDKLGNAIDEEKMSRHRGR
jgi:hypothetical protein